MKIFKLSIVLFIITLFSMPAWAKFCSECGKPLNDGAKFCSECGAGVENTTSSEKPNSTINDLNKIREKLECMEELCAYLESSNKASCMDKFPNCKFRFQKGLEDLQKESLTDSQKLLMNMYKLKWQFVEEGYDMICKDIVPENRIYYIGLLNGYIKDVIAGASIKYGEKCIEFCKKGVSISGNTVKVKSTYLQVGKGKNDRISKGQHIKILAVKSNQMLIYGEVKAFLWGMPSTFVKVWLSKEEIFNRTDFKDNNSLMNLLKNYETLEKEILALSFH